MIANMELVEQYLDWLRTVKGAKAITVYQYEGKLRDWLDFIGPMQLAEVRTATIETWLQRERGGRAKGQRAKPATIGRDATIIRNLYRFGMARGHLNEDPTMLLVTPAVKNVHPKPVPDDVWIPTWVEPTCAPSDEARVVLGLGYFCGLRRAEIAALRGAQVDLRRQRLVAFARKGGGDDVLDFGECVGVLTDGIVAGDVPDLIGVEDNFLQPLERLVKASGRGPIMPWRLTPEGTPDPHEVYRKFQRWGYQAFTPHMTRHSFVTNLLRVRVPIHLASVLANHSSLATTMRYAKLGGQDLRDFRRRQRRSRWEE